jgi:DNA-binding transcriptional MerR regulator
VSTYTIGEIADRSGFTASALRYYEGIGLVTPAARTDAGYRIYDEHILARLAFIDRAKQFGCSLEEIADLAAIWDGGRCGPAQRHFHELVTTKIAEANRQVAELAAYIEHLDQAAAQLSGDPVDGPCGEGCACVIEPAATLEPVAVRPGPRADTDVPIACQLDAGSILERVAEWNAVLGYAKERTTTADGALRVELADDVPLDELIELVSAEQRCCAFFSFVITIDGGGAALEIRAPDGATDIVASLFGEPT